MNTDADSCYKLIDNKASSNAFIQGMSGFFGVVATLAVDAASIPTIYGSMWNEIRAVYHQKPIATDEALEILASIMPEVVSDILFDKVLGNVPIIGIYFNAICAKQMTWRLGTLFTLLASRGEAVNEAACREAMIMIRHMFPQKDMFMFTTPNYDNFMRLVASVEGYSVEKFNEKVVAAITFLEND